MNEKRAKKLRALVRHLQTKAGNETNWTAYQSLEPLILDPSCGRAIYQQMKKRDLLSSQR